MPGSIFREKRLVPNTVSLEGTCIPSLSAITIDSDEDYADIVFNDVSPSYPGAGLLEIVGADAAEFSLNYADTGVIEPSGSSQTIRITRAGGGAPGQVLNAALEVVSTRGTFQLPIRCACPDEYATMELQAWFDGQADHIFAFGSADPYGDTGRHAGADLTRLDSNCVREATTVPCCQGQMKQYNSPSTYWNWTPDEYCGRSQDRTYEYVHYPYYATSAIGHWGPYDKDVTLAQQIAGISQLSSSAASYLGVRQYSGGYLTRITTSLLRADWQNKWGYYALQWVHATGMFRFWNKMAGGTLQYWDSATGISAGDATPAIHRWCKTVDFDYITGSNITAYTSHFAIYPVVLSQVQIEARCSILGF